jgi:SAM-dependent methyltransferase
MNESISQTIDSEFTNSLYKLPKYYHIAFLRDLEPEIRFFEQCFKKYVPFQVKHVIEPACGTGVYLIEFPKYGYKITGYDLSEEMVDFTNNLVEQEQMSKDANAVVANMIDYIAPQKLDSAFICLNSLGYIREDSDIISHFKNTSKSLKKDALYIIDMSFMCEELIHEKKEDETWISEFEGTRVEATWQIYKYSIPERIRHVKLTMKVQDGKKHLEFEEFHDLRLWIYEDFIKLANAGGFELVDIYDEKFNLIQKRDGICGEDGFVYMILKNKG